VNEPKTVITVKEAKKILGKAYEHLSDKQIKDMITILHLIAKGTIEPKSSIYLDR